MEICGEDEKAVRKTMVKMVSGDEFGASTRMHALSKECSIVT
jgi:hypothetical protein